jgi:hypothetical protein
MINSGRILVPSTVVVVLAALCGAGWYAYRGSPTRPKPVRIHPLEHVEEENPISSNPSSVLCGKSLHLRGTVSSQVNPESYAVVDHVDGDVTHITNVRKALDTTLPVAGDRVDVWGVVECEGPRYHVNESRRQNASR